MALQTVVNTKLAYGVPGSFYDDSPRRVAPYVVEAGSVAKAFTLDATQTDKAVVGGTGAFAGIAVNGKEYTITGTTASTAFRSGDIAQLCTMGHLVVVCDNAVSVGNACFFNNTTGELHAAAAGATEAGYTEIVGSKFIFVAGTAAGEPVVLELN